MLLLRLLLLQHLSYLHAMEVYNTDRPGGQQHPLLLLLLLQQQCGSV